MSATYHKNELKEVMSALHTRLGDSAWSIVYKSLLVIHIMIREGHQDAALSFLSSRSGFLDLQHIRNIKSGDSRSLLRYGKYLSVRSREFGSTKIDFVKDAQINKDKGALRKLSVDKGLLREVESVETQIKALISCRFAEADINNDIVLTCFRMLVNDLLCLYQTLNEGVINILEHYFEMSKYDAERALEIYKTFVTLTTDVVNYLRIAKHLEYATKLHVPTIRHAPVALADSLEDYLNDPNFEVNRSQYLAEKEYKNNGNVVSKQSKQQDQQQQQQDPQQQQHQQQQQQPPSVVQPLHSQVTANPWAAQLGNLSLQPLQIQYTQALQPQPTNNPFLQQQAQNAQIQAQQTQQAQLQQVQVQPNQVQSLQTGSFSSYPANTIVPSFTGAGFGGYTVQPQSTGNPFLQQQQSQQQQQVQAQSQQQETPVKLVSSATGNNPFSLNYKSTHLSSISEQSSVETQHTNNPFSLSKTATGNVAPQQTGNALTNPFQSSNAAGGGTHATMGGYEQLPTQPVFPQTIQEQRTNQFNQQANWELQNQIQQNRMSTFNGFQQQPQQQQQQKQQLQNQFTGFQQQQPVLQNQFTGFQQQQPQLQQQQQQAAYSMYNGPSLI